MTMSIRTTIVAAGAIVAAAAAAAVAAELPNALRVDHSDFDGSTEVRVAPGWVYRGESLFGGGDFRLGLHWSSTEPDRVVITAIIHHTIVPIEHDRALQFNVDGEIVALDAASGARWDYDVIQGATFQESSRRFEAPLELVRRVVAAETVKAKLVTVDGYLEGDYGIDRPSAARRGWRKFLTRVHAELGLPPPEGAATPSTPEAAPPPGAGPSLDAATFD